MSRCWTFLEPYYPASSTCPAYLAWAIDALSLTHLWHEAYSEAALVAARECYVRALGETRKALSCPPQRSSQAVVLAALVLDLVEKIMSTTPPALASHIDGALSMVSSIGLDQFQSPPSFPILVRLSNHALFGCLLMEARVPAPLVAFRVLVQQGLDAAEHPKGMDALFVRYINLQHDFRAGIVSDELYVKSCYDLDIHMAAGEHHMPLSWQYSPVERQADANGLFSQHCHIYKHRNFAQARNMMRVFRLLLNEAVIEYAELGPADRDVKDAVDGAHANVETLVMQISSSVAQYADCSGLAKTLLRTTDKSTKADSRHTHAHHHVKDCYTLLFPLYAAARSRVSHQNRLSIIKQLHYIADHFCIRNAMHVANLLEQDSPPSVWEVYVQLGSYAFMA